MRDGDQAGMVEIPQYQCHKKVRALKIKSVDADNATLSFLDESNVAPIHVSQAYLDKHEPVAGGYYVVYEGGYKSFSPAKEFEEGYTLLNSKR